MNTYKWTCLACKTPNVLVHDETKEGHFGLNCTQCGEPGVFESEEMRIRMSPGFPEAFIDVHSTNMTAVLDSTVAIHTASAPRIEIDYASPQRIVKMKGAHWR